MAILPAHPGINISTVCNGVALEEYTDDDEGTHTNVVSRYVEAISGAELSIKCELTAPWPPYSILLDYHLDQKWMCGNLIRSASYKAPYYSCIREGSKTATNVQTFLHNFTFAELTIGKLSSCVEVVKLLMTPKDTAAVSSSEQLMKVIKGMGDIAVKAYFVENIQARSVARCDLNNDLMELGAIPEKVLKGSSLSHQTWYVGPQRLAVSKQELTMHVSLRAGRLIGSGPAMVNDCEYIDPSGRPFANFSRRCVWLYRSDFIHFVLCRSTLSLELHQLPMTPRSLHSPAM